MDGGGEQFLLLKRKTGVTEEHMRDLGSGFPDGLAYFLAGCYQSAHSGLSYLLLEECRKDYWENSM